jgi:hypothetical protein
LFTQHEGGNIFYNRLDDAILNLEHDMENVMEDEDLIGDGEDLVGEEEEYDENDEEIEKDYDLHNPVSKLDKRLAQELKEARNYKLAEGVTMVEYDAFGLPKTKEMQQLKKDLGWTDELLEEQTNGTFIPNPEWMT